MGQRHYEDDDFPTHCDHCPAAFGPGAKYRRVLLVMDALDNVVPTAGEKETRSGMEDSWELVLCLPCQERLALWLRTPLQVAVVEGDLPGELDDGALAEELEKELYILAHDPEPRKPNGSDVEGE
mgnify:CR=1 FL=1